MYLKKITKKLLLISITLLGHTPYLYPSSIQKNNKTTLPLLSTTLLMFLTKNLKSTNSTSQENLRNSINTLQYQPQKLTQKEKKILIQHITKSISQLDSKPTSPSTQPLHQQLIQLKKDLALLDNTSSHQPIPRTHEILVPANGHCLYTTIILGYLLPVVDNIDHFNQRLGDIMGTDQQPITPTQLVTHYSTLDYLDSHTGFQQLVHHLLKKIKTSSHTWGGPIEIQAIAEILNINIQEHTPDPENPKKLVISDITSPTTSYINGPEATLHIVRDTPLPQELISPESDPDLEKIQHQSLQNLQHRHHYRLYYPTNLPPSPLPQPKTTPKTITPTTPTPPPSTPPITSYSSVDTSPEELLILDIPYINKEHQQRIIARLTLSQSPHLESIIQVLNQKLGPIQDPEHCQNIGHYLACIGHFYLAVLEEYPPQKWVVQSLKIDIARQEIKNKDTLGLDIFHTTLQKYEQNTHKKQFVKTLYTLYNYTKNPKITLYDLTTILEHLIANPQIQPKAQPSLYALQKKIIKKKIIAHPHFNNYQKDILIQTLYSIINPQPHPYTSTLIQDLLQLINTQKKYSPTLQLLHLIQKEKISPETLQKAFTLAKKKKICTRPSYQKILYYFLLKKKLNTVTQTPLPSVQKRISSPLWKLILQANQLKEATHLFDRLHNVYATNIDQLFLTLGQLTDYNPPSTAYTKVRKILLEQPPKAWTKYTHDHLLHITFSAPHELSVKEILQEIQHSAEQENIPIDIKKLAATYQEIEKEYTKNQNSLQQLSTRLSQYRVQAKERNKGETTLHIACLQADLLAVKYLVEKQKANPNASNNQKTTPLHYAAKKGHLPIFIYLMQHQADPYKTNYKGSTCLHYASSYNHLDLLQWLGDNTSLDLANSPNRNRKTPLDLAALKGHLEIVTYLLYQLPAPFQQAKKALEYVNKTTHPYIFHHLTTFTLEHIQQKIQDYQTKLKNNLNQDTLLHIASRAGDLATLRYLIELKQHVVKPNLDNDTPLHYACEKGHLSVLQYLCKHTSTKLQNKNIDGQTPLDIAKKRKHTHIIDYLTHKTPKKKKKTPQNSYKKNSSHASIIAKWHRKEIIQWAQNYRKAYSKPAISQALAVIKRAVQLHKGFLPRPVQLLTLLVLYQQRTQQKTNSSPLKGILAQVMTGQGKSITIAMLAILHALEGHTIDIITTSPELSKREAKNKASLFSLFGITVAENSTEKDPSLLDTLKRVYADQYIENPNKSQVVYGTPSNFQADILRTEFSGQKEVRAGRKFDIVITDEADNLQVDQRKFSTYIGESTPGMHLLQLPLAAVLNRVRDIHTHIITKKDGTHHYITQDFKLNNDQIILHQPDPNSSPEEYIIPIEKEKDAFIKELALAELQPLFRTPTKKEIEALEEIEKIEEQITLQHNRILELKQQTIIPQEAIQQQEQQLKKLQQKRKNSTWYQKEYTTYLDIPCYLREHIQNQLPKWIENALHAHCYFHKDQQYTIVDNKIIPIDLHNTGVLQHNLVWSHGLTQFLSIKHDLLLNPDMLTTNYISNIALFSRYNTLYGLTGTLGEKSNKAFLHTTYHINCIIIPPHVKRTIQGNTNPHLPCKKLTPYLCNDLDTYEYALRSSILQHILLGRSLLIICPYILAVNEIKKIGQRISNLLPIKITTYTGQTVFNKNTIGPGELLIATNIAGRGFDLTTTPELEKNGGLHVCITFPPQNTRVEAQNMGRTARKGKLGTAQLIIYDPDITTFAQLQQKRKKQEDEANQKALQDVKYISFKDHLFQRFCQLLDTLFPNQQTFYNHLHREEIENLWNLQQQQNEKMWKNVQRCFPHIKTNDLQQIKKNSHPFKSFCEETYPQIKKLIEEKTWQDFLNRTKQPDHPHWGTPIRDSIKEQFALFLCSITTLLEEKKYQQVKEKFQDFTKQIYKRAKENNLPKNPHYYVQEGNIYAQKMLWKHALENYHRAIKQDPILSLHAYYNKAYVLFKQEKKEEAKEALQQTQHILNTYYKPRLITLHHLITEKGGKKNISNQVQRQLNLLLLIDEYIKNALATIYHAKENNKEVIINDHTPLKQVIAHRAEKQHTDPIANKEEIEQFTLDGLTHLFTLKEIEPFPTWTVAGLILISAGEMIIGGILIAYSGGAASNLGYAILQEGISDIIQAIKVGYTREFDWKEWGIQKGITVAVGIASAGINHVTQAKKMAKKVKNIKKIGNMAKVDNIAKFSIKDQGKDLLNVGKGVVKNLKNYCKIGESQEAKNLRVLFKDIVVHHLKKGVAKECLNTLADYSIEKLLYHQLEHIIIYLIKPSIAKNLNNSNLQPILQIDQQNKNNLYQDKILQEAIKILQGNWSGTITNLIHNIFQGKNNPSSTNKLAKIVNIKHLYTFLRGIGINCINNKALHFLEMILAGIDCFAYTDNFNQELSKRIKLLTKNLKKTQPIHPTFGYQYTPQKENTTTNTYTTTYTAPSPQPHHNSPYAPRSSIPSEDHHSNQDDQVQEIVHKLQEKLYTPSSTNYIVDTLSEHIAQHITQQIHQKGFKPVTSHYINKGVDQLVKKAERELNKRIEQQQQQNRINYTLSNTQTQEKSSTLLIPKKPKNEIEQLAKATHEGVEGDITHLAMMAKEHDITVLIYSPEGKLLRIEGNGKKQAKVTYTPPTDQSPGHWTPKDQKDYLTTGPTNCLFDTMAAVLGNKQTSQQLRKNCAQYILSNAHLLKPILHEYYTLAITNPKAIYTGAGVPNDIIITLMKCEEKWNEFKKNHPLVVTLLKEGIGIGLFALGAGSTIATGGAAGLASVMLNAIGGYAVGRIYDYVIQHNQGKIEGGKKWIAQGLKKLDSEINDERANWMADKLMSTLILVGRYATQYAAGRGLKALKTKIHTTCYRKQYLQKLPKAPHHKGYKSYYEFKKHNGSAGAGKAWHHIVEQNNNNVARFGAQAIHNTKNIIKLPHGRGLIHNLITGHYNSKQRYTDGMIVRKWLSTQSYEAQRAYGIWILKKFGWKL